MIRGLVNQEDSQQVIYVVSSHVAGVRYGSNVDVCSLDRLVVRGWTFNARIDALDRDLALVRPAVVMADTWRTRDGKLPLTRHHLLDASIV